MSAASPKRTSPPATALAGERFGARDAIALAIVLAVAFILMARAGSRRGIELMPWPDGLEYAAQAVNLNDGRGPVMHFGGYSYPSRYTEGYPLILAAALPIVGHDIARLYTLTIAMGLLAIVAIYLLALKLFGRPSAIVAAVMLALSPVFITYSTLVLSDVPTLAVTLLAAHALVSATEEEGAAARLPAFYASWAIFGLIAGFAAIIRPTNATIVAGIVLGLVLVPPSIDEFRQFAIAGAAFIAGFVVMPLLQMHSNSIYLGGAFQSGYAWWVPEVYGSAGRTFSAQYLFGPTMPRNPHGNFPIYVTTLLGIDGLLGDQGDPRYLLYPFAAAVFAAVGIVAVFRQKENRLARRAVVFGLGFLGALVAVYLFYLFTEIAFILPAAFVLFVAAGYGAVVANRSMRQTFAARRRSTSATITAVCVAVLDLMLVISLTTELSVRLNAEPRESTMVPALAEVETTIGPSALVVSNISLQFLELYLPDDARDFVGLNSLDPGEDFTDYHLNRLYTKRAAGWAGALPQVLFDGDAMTPAVESALIANARKPGGAYLLLCAPESQDYADVLRSEVDKMNAAFALEPIIQNRTIALYRITAR
ncbi:MAG: glycosyltransferase family 39 protein [Candidatus Binataceae bacterium]